mmetsp:Transcript_5127/g.4993  ORF Transcript_5127/g.4993 Transcript_5127/m.4993 type:complete len:81 (+) Transcript_5127:565-807(+)
MALLTNFHSGVVAAINDLTSADVHSLVGLRTVTRSLQSDRNQKTFCKSSGFEDTASVEALGCACGGDMLLPFHFRKPTNI